MGARTSRASSNDSGPWALISYKKITAVSYYKICFLYLIQVTDQLRQFLLFMNHDKTVCLSSHSKSGMLTHRFVKQDTFFRNDRFYIIIH